ncbi:Transcriptional regulator, contains HTH domain (plasmid) [Haloferax volcanii]|nr:Transcriptional regulator, contains HTH domain [Haloferax lucentense]
MLTAVERDDAASELATKLGHSESYFPRAVADLTEKGLSHTERDGRRKRAIPSYARVVGEYHSLVRRHSHRDFPEFLTDNTLEVLNYLDQPQPVADIAEQSSNYCNIVNWVLKRFRDGSLALGTRGARQPQQVQVS